jgi:hypothetical protein
MSSTTELTLTEIETAEFNLVAAIAGFPDVAAPMRAKAIAVLAKLRCRKAELLKANPDVLRKSSSKNALAAPHWIGLPSVAPEVTAMVKAARDRQSEERRLAKRAGTDLSTALATIKTPRVTVCASGLRREANKSAANKAADARRAGWSRGLKSPSSENDRQH